VQLGDWRIALGDRAGALDAYRQALEWQPDKAAILERVERTQD
jgi:cytochrome c-type biogenesis protein CcmH/NrfG